MGPPFLLGGHGSPWAPMSPRRVSPIRSRGRPDHSIGAPLHGARAHSFGEPAVDRAAGQPLSQTLSTAYEHANPRGSSQSPLESLTDSAYQSGRHGPPHHLRCSNAAGPVSSVSSTLSSSAVTPSSHYTSVGSMDDGRPQRSLPPISTVGLEALANPAFSDSGGPPTFSSSSYLPNSHALPPPLHSPFLSSSSSGKQHATRPSGGVALSCDSGMTALSLADGSGMMPTGSCRL